MSGSQESLFCMDSIKLPYYLKLALISLGMLAFIAILYLTQSIIVPVIYAAIIAVVLSPLVDFLVRKKMNRILAISISLLLLGGIAIFFILLLYMQIDVFRDTFPKLVARFYGLPAAFMLVGIVSMNISPKRRQEW
jgi:predicted PurR-regulated permease PerM